MCTFQPATVNEGQNYKAMSRSSSMEAERLYKPSDPSELSSIEEHPSTKLQGAGQAGTSFLYEDKSNKTHDT